MQEHENQRDTNICNVCPTELYIAKLNKTIDLQNLNAIVVNNDAIAHSLALINRFNGHTRHPYSVAQHTLNMYLITQLAHIPNMHPDLTFWIAYHDAPEIITGDIAAPIKIALNCKEEVDKYHSMFYGFIAETFNRAPITLELQAIVKQWDLLIGTMECEYFGIPVNNNRVISDEMWKIKTTLDVLHGPHDYMFYERSWDDVESEFNALLDVLSE